MKLIDISWPITADMTEYKDKRTVSLEPIVKEGSDARETMICMKSHTGTHIDAPSHFLEHGKTLDQLPLDATCGRARVLDCTLVEGYITKDDLVGHPISSGDIVLLKTTNSDLSATDPFNHEFVWIGADAAEYLVQCGIQAIGFDYLGIERGQPNHETHKAFMRNDIPIIEGLRLADVHPGEYQLWCLPLSIPGIDGAPARAVLLPS